MSAADFDWGVSGDLIAQLRAAEATISRVRDIVRRYEALALEHPYHAFSGPWVAVTTDVRNVLEDR